MATIGENIRKARKALKMSQDELASAIGANRVTISKYENGGYLPSVPALKRLAAALHTTPEELSTENELSNGTIQFKFMTSLDNPKEKIVSIGPDDSLKESLAIRERLRRDPEYRLLFDAASKATPEHLRAAAAMLKALEGQEDD